VCWRRTPALPAPRRGEPAKQANQSLPRCHIVDIKAIKGFRTLEILRIRTILSDGRMKTVTSDIGDLALDGWLTDYIGDSDASNGSVTIIDLSLVPAEVVHIITAVIALMTL